MIVTGVVVEPLSEHMVTSLTKTDKTRALVKIAREGTTQSAYLRRLILADLAR